MQLDDEADNGQEMSAIQLIGKPSTHDMALPEHEEGPNHPSAKVGNTGNELFADRFSGAVSE